MKVGRVVGVLVGCVVVALLAGGRTAWAVRAQTPSTTPVLSVGIPGEATVQSGDSVHFEVPGGPPITTDPVTGGTVYGFNPAPLTVYNSTAAPLTVSVAGDESGVTFTGAAGATLQIRQSPASTVQLGAAEAAMRLLSDIDGASRGYAQTHYAGCMATVPDGSSISCGRSPIRVNGDALIIAVTATPATDQTRETDVQPLSWVTLVAAAPDGSVSSVTVADYSRESMHVLDDGATISASVPDGYVATARVRTDELDSKAGRLTAAAAGCLAQAASLLCPLAALTANSALELEAALQLPTTPIPLTLATPTASEAMTLQATGDDPAAGGVTVAATFANDAETLTGSGVLRPWLDTGDVQLLLALPRDDGSVLYLEGVLRTASGAATATNSIPPPRGQRRPGRAATRVWPRTSTTGTRYRRCLALSCLSAVRSSLCSYPELGDQVDPASGRPPLPGHQASAPSVGTAGQNLMFWTECSDPLYDDSASATYWIDFGDGSPPQNVPAFMHFDPASRYHIGLSDSTPVDHAYAAAGTYTIVFYRDDGAGARMFGASMIRITAATP